ncbi:MAG TPA: cupredoxin family copper-binding protein [Anaeromyxobacteraceae bacterium]|nr:cupredoxin family copper-binding protein [Anaeromyxobacteraceae bacterium]
MRTLLAALCLIMAAPARPEAAAPADGGQVRISGFVFEPRDLKVRRGSTVRWVNQDQEPHTVTADEGAFGSRGLDAGEGYAFTFQRAGRFPYHCALHPHMTGTVIVE